MKSTSAISDNRPSAANSNGSDCNPTDEKQRRPFVKRLARLGIIWGVWTIVALFFSTQVFMMYYSERQPIPYKQAFLVQGIGCFLWALVTPLVLWLARRFCIDRNQWFRKVALHFVVSLLLVSALISLHFVIYMILAGRASSITPMRLVGYLYPNLDRWLLVYWLMLLMSHAFNYYNSYRKGELKASQLRTQLVQSQLEALKMQVQPHFLFNTLHSISALLRKTQTAPAR